MSESMRLFAKNLIEIRKMRNLTQEGLAELANLSQQSVSKYESARGWPGTKVVARLAEVLKVPESRFWFDPDSLDVDLALRVMQAFAEKHRG